MVLSNSEVVERFVRGGEEAIGSANNMAIAENAYDWKLLVGYGHAVYAAIPPHEEHSPVVHVGWRGASGSTNQHISLIDNAAPSSWDRQEGRPNFGDYATDPSMVEIAKFESNDKDYSTSQRRSREMSD